MGRDLSAFLLTTSSGIVGRKLTLTFLGPLLFWFLSK